MLPRTTARPPLLGSFELGPLLDSLVRELEQVPEVRWAYLFGSAARGQPAADLDIGVMLDSKAQGVQVIGHLALALELAAREMTVDLVDLAAAAPALAGNVVRDGRLLVDRDPEARRNWEIEAQRRAFDIEPWLREFARLQHAALAQRVR